MQTAILVLILSAADTAALTLADIDAWRARLLPASAELRWTRIPWNDAFWDAVAEAQTTPRPILLWAMNGHPLGCT